MKTSVFILKYQHTIDYLYEVIAILRSQLRPETCKTQQLNSQSLPHRSNSIFPKLPQTAPHNPTPLLSDDSCAVFDDVTTLRAVNWRRRGSQSASSARIKLKCFRFVFKKGEKKAEKIYIIKICKC